MLRYVMSMDNDMFHANASQSCIKLDINAQYVLIYFNNNFNSIHNKLLQHIEIMPKNSILVFKILYLVSK